MSVLLKNRQGAELVLVNEGWQVLLRAAAAFGWQPLDLESTPDRDSGELGCRPRIGRVALVCALERALKALRGPSHGPELTFGLRRHDCESLDDSIKTRRQVLEELGDPGGELIDEFLELAKGRRVIVTQ
jgi:hypothetical protein